MRRSFTATVRGVLGTTRILHRVWQDAGVAHDTTWAGLTTALKELWRHRTVGTAGVLAIHAANHPDRDCVIDRSRRLTYREVVTETTQLAEGLVQRGLGPGRTIGVMVKNRAEFLCIAAAVDRLGATLLPLSYRYKTDEAAAILAHAGAHALFFDADLAPIVAPLPTRLPHLALAVAVPEAPGFVSYAKVVQTGDPYAPGRRVTAEPTLLIYTSGTTGQPKGASRRTSLRSIGAILACVHALGLRSDDRHLAVCPLYHTAGLGFAFFTLLLGGTVVLLEHFDAEDVLRIIAGERITTAMMVPTMYHRLVELPAERFAPYDVSSLRRFVSGGAPLPVPLSQAVMGRFGPKLCDLYGATETGWITLALPADLARKPGTIGKALAGIDLRVLDAGGRDVGSGAVGHLYVRSPLLMDGYHANAPATRAAMREGFFAVGDLAWRDAEGYLFLAGRTTDMVISGGVNIYPQDIEATLATHADILEAAVVGVPDPEWGERVRAFIVQRAGAALQAASVMAFCKTRLADFKCPREIFMVAALPRTPTGKVVKNALRAWNPQTPWPWTPGADGAGSVPTPSEP